MDQPPQQSPPISVEGILAWFLGVVATLGAIVVRGKFRVKALREKVEAETAPSIQKENIEWSEGIIQNWREEIAAIRKETREEIATERARADRERERADEERHIREEWQARTLACESRVPYLERQNANMQTKLAEMERQNLQLQTRVAELEKIVAGGAARE